MIAALESLAPISLVGPDRLDLVVKWRFFLHLNDRADPDAVRLYLWHINARTGGVEPGGGKSTLAQYLTQARALHASMKLAGFDRRHPIRIGSNGRLMDGAHRVACALALRIRTIDAMRVDRPGSARPWGMAFFDARGIDASDAAQIEADYRTLTA